MAIKRFGSYETTKAYTEFEQLPKGAYILKIMGAEVCENSIGQYVKISADIAEGEYKDFFAKEYKAQQSEDKKWHCNYLLNVPKDDGTEQDGWTARRFKTVIEAIETSNPGYHFDWDEKKFKGKLVGGLFNMREYQAQNGDVRQATNLAQLCTVDSVREGKAKIPADKLLKNKPVSAPSTDFVSVPDGMDEELPF